MTSQVTNFTTTQKGPYVFLKADYGSEIPDPQDMIVIKGPYELNALIQHLKQILQKTYPNWEGHLEVRRQSRDIYAAE